MRGSETESILTLFARIDLHLHLKIVSGWLLGEHTSSFYEWQGFMEGAVLSGQRAAVEVVRRLR